MAREEHGKGDLLSPAMFLMKTCIVDSGSADDERDERDEMDEMLLERMAAIGRGFCLRWFKGRRL